MTKISKQLFRDVLDNDKTSKDEYNKMCPKCSRSAILYSNPKINKPVVNNLPKFRPILSAINTPGYNSANFLIPILEPLTHNEFSTKDSFNFAKEIKTYDSFFFTNIPLNETADNCVSDLHKKNFYNGKLSKRDLFKLIQTETRESSVIFIIYFINK